MAAIDKIETTDDGPNQNHTCSPSSSETSIAPSTSDAKMGNKVTNCSNDSVEPQPQVATVDVSCNSTDDQMDEQTSIESESLQLPTSSTEDTNVISGTDDTMEKGAEVDEPLTDTAELTENKRDDDKENVDCAVDSSDVTDKMDLMTTGDEVAALEATCTENVQHKVAEAEHVPTIESESELAVEMSKDSSDTAIALPAEPVAPTTPPPATPPPTEESNSSSSNAKSDKNDVHEHCDSAESVKEADEQLSNSPDDATIDSNADSGAHTEQLASKNEQINEIDNNGSPNEQQATRNGSNDCDSSDVNFNQVESNENGAISANYACEPDENVELDAKSVSEEPNGVKSPAECTDNQESIEINVQTEQLPAPSAEVSNEQINTETSSKETDEQPAGEAAADDSVQSSGGNLVGSEAATETKCAYDFNECVSSPEIAPIGFKDKFKKSFEIMEKSKQESNSIEKMMNEQPKIDSHIGDGDKERATSASPDNDIKSSNQVIKNDKGALNVIATASLQNIQPSTSTISDVCDLTDDNELQIDETQSHPAASSEEPSKQEPIPASASSTHSTIDRPENTSSRNSDAVINSTRTIIISPQSIARLETVERKSAEPQSVVSDDAKATGSLYITNPDFVNSLPPFRVESIKDLSELKMKPPDFSKLQRSSELHVPHPDFTRAYDQRSPIPVDATNFAEISKKFNYISDLQLKNPPPTSKSNEPTQSSCTSLYVKTPDFSSKLRNHGDNESTDEPTPHIVHKNMYRSHADSSSKPNATPRSTDYSHIPEDITMSLVKHAVKTPQQKVSAMPKPPTPVHRVDSRSVPTLPTPHIYSPTPLERPNSQNYYSHPGHPGDKAYLYEFYQRSLAASPANHQYSSPAHVFHHRDVPVAIAPGQRMHHPYEQYPSTEKASTPKGVQPLMDASAVRSNEPAMYARPPSTNALYLEQNRLRPIQSMAPEVQPSSSSHMNAFSYAPGRPASALGLTKPADYYNHMNPPQQKWPSQTRITQSPISTAPSPHTINSQNTRISQSQSPISASPLPYQMHRQSPSNMQYQSPHNTPSPSPYGYGPSPVPVKPSSKLPANAQTNNIPSQKKSNDYTLSVANSVDQKQLPNSYQNEPKTKQKDHNRPHDARDQHQPNQHRSSSSSRNSTKTDVKYTDRMDYKRPITLLDPYVFRQASDTDVNYQIIKKTLNKEIPTPSFNRKNADPSSGLSLSSRINAHAHLPPSDQSARKDKNPHDSRLVYLDSKQPYDVYQAKQNELNKHHYPQNTQHPPHPSYHPATENHYDPARAPHSASTSSHQYAAAAAANHRSPMPPQPKSISQGTSGVEPNHVPYKAPARPKHEPKTDKPIAPPAESKPANVNDVSSTRPSIFGPTKRESPLDLSVKTVKTKADSTVVHDYSLPSRRPETIPQSLKVDFAPNFTNSPADANRMADANRNNAGYRSQSRPETAPAPTNNSISNHINHTQTSSQPVVVQPAYPQMDLQQRSQHYNVNMDPRYKSADNNSAYLPPKPSPRSASGSAESKSRKETKPMIFGQKPEELKNFKPDERAFQADAMARQLKDSAAFNKGNDKTVVAPKHNAKENEMMYRMNAMHAYPNMQAPSMRHPGYAMSNERPSEVIKFVARPQAVNRPPETSTAEQHNQIPYPHYNQFESMHRNQPPPAFKHTHPGAEYATPNKMMDDRYKMAHQYPERAEAQYPLSASVPQKRPIENGMIDGGPAKQARYDEEIKYQHNSHPYYAQQDRNIPMYGNQFAPKMTEKAISTPVIVQPQHSMSNESKYHYPPYPHMSNDNRSVRPADGFDQSAPGQGNPAFRPPQYYSSPYHMEKAQEDAKLKAQMNVNSSSHPMHAQMAPHQPHAPPHAPPNHTYSQPYRMNEWPPKPANNEHPMGYAPRPPYEPLPLQPNRYESSVIKTADFSKIEPPAEPFRANSTNNNSTSNVNNNMPKQVDQSVISKLRNNLELKEMEKQKQMKTQMANEKAADDVNKSDLASILAARIRTKGELKGFTPIPPVDVASSTKDNVTVANSIDTSAQSESLAGLDLMDWGSTCNDFLEQLQNNTNKRSKAQRRSNFGDAEASKSDNLPQSSTVKPSEKSSEEQLASNKPKSLNDDDTSSDEDKPLLLLRQQSLSENSKNRKNLSNSDEKTSPNRKKTKSDKSSPNISLDAKKRVAALESSSESEEDVRKRSKKLIRKPRTRSSISNRGGDDDDDDTDATSVCASSKNEKTMKKRSRKDKSSSESEVDANRNSKKRKSLEVNSDSDDDEDLSTAAKKNNRTPQPTKVEETMTRSKRKRELEMEIANSKVLRNDKMVKCNAFTLEKRGDSKSTPEKKNSRFTDTSDKSASKNSDSSKRSKSSDKKKVNESDTESKKSGQMKKNLRNRQQTSSSESESSSSDNESIITERLRSRKSKLNPASDSDANKDAKNNKNKPGCSNSVGESADEKPIRRTSKTTPKKSVADLDMSEDSRSQFPPGWEEQAYEYKRSLKIPARLITIGRPSWHQHRKSTSLPDLDPQHSSDASETFAELNKKSANASAIRKGKSTDKKTGDSSTLPNNDSDNAASDTKSKSIIDLLHQRVIRPIIKSKKSRNQVGQNEPKILPQSNEVELLPTPGSEGKPENVFKTENVFDTAVLKSRTRKEYKAMKTQEIIREVFGGEDRPASAPPYNFELMQQKLEQKQQQLEQMKKKQQQVSSTSQAEPAETKPLTFDQQYQQYLEKLNVDYGEKIRKVKSAAENRNNAMETDQIVPKTEKIDDDMSLNQDEESHDTELNECDRNIDDIKEEPCDSLERGDTPSVMSEADRATPTSFSGVLKAKKGRGNRYGRRKGSSGFDYIRKKKKPVTSQNSSQGTPAVVKRRSAAINYLEFKDENDITREIRSWVLNKGVGESVLHKAARLGYIDVVVYCLLRLEMPPDQKDNAGYTPLHEACSRGFTDIARVLLQYGANHSETAHSGIRPLHEAVDNGYLEIVRLLLSYGADPLLATYAGQTPIMLAEDDDVMVAFLKNHLFDVQNTGPNKMPWKFEGAWKMSDPDNIGYEIFDDLPEENEAMPKSNKNAQEPCSSTTNEKTVKTPKRKSPLRRQSKQKDTVDAKNDADDRVSDAQLGDSDAEIFEIEESDSPLIPLYQLKDEGIIKWVLLSDLCYLLKVKSKDTLLKLLYPGSSPTTTANQKEILRELKMSEFLEKAICLQLLCAGEKLNIRSSKVTLVKYNDCVKNALGIKTIKMRL